MDEKVIIYADKTILSIKGLSVRGLKPLDIEKILADKLGTLVRVIGVSGSSIDMDVYNMDPESLKKNEQGIIKAVSAIDGVSAAEFAKIDYSKACEIEIDKLPPRAQDGCSKERWINGAQ